MKLFVRLSFFIFLLSSFQCDKNETAQQITPNQLEQKKAQIVAYIDSFSCENATACKSIAFGAKPCGGPRTFLIYPNSVDQNTLEQLVAEYYQLDNQYNIQTGAMSDCMVISPPNNIGCVNGKCKILD